MNTTGKLFKLKKWLTLDETAKHLSTVFDEEVSHSDILRLALDDHLRLSVNFVNFANVVQGKIIPLEEAPFIEIPHPDRDGELVKCLNVIPIDEEKGVTLGGEVTEVDGIWDLLMLGAERLNIENYYQQLTDGPEITLINIEGVFVQAPDDENIVCQVQERFPEEVLKQIYPNKRWSTDDSFYPTHAIPADCTLVVRMEALDQLKASLSEPTEGVSTPSTKTKNYYLKTIGALAQALCNGLTGENNKDAEVVLAAIATSGIEAPIGAKALAKYLKEASDL